MYYTYVLKSESDGEYYIGCTNDLRKRFQEHSKSKTKHRLPLQIVYYEACLNKNNAFKREKYFKTGYGRRFLETRI